MLQVGESLENARRRFPRRVQWDDVILGVDRHSCYLAPDKKKRGREALAWIRTRKKARKEQD